MAVMDNHQDVVQFNCNGIRGNRIHIQQIIIKYTPKFILLQELRINKTDKISFKGYVFISKFIDDVSRSKPSVGILIKEGIIFSIINTPDDICVIGIDTFNFCPISLYSFYDNHRIGKLSENNLMDIVKAGKYKSLIMGDFNVKNALWDKNVNSTWNDKRTSELLNFIANSDFVVLNDGTPTRISPVFNTNNSALDLTLIHKDLSVDFIWKVANSTFGSDHIPTLLTSVGLNLNPHEHTIWDLKSTDWNAFNDFCRLELIQDEVNIDVMDKIIHDQIYNGLINSSHAFFSPNNKKRVPPWWDSELKELKVQKNKYLNDYIRDQSKENLIRLKKFTALYKRALKSKKDLSWVNFIDGMNDEEMDAGMLWKRIKAVNGKNYDKKIINMFGDNGQVIDDPVILVNMLADHYREVSDFNSLSASEMTRFNSLKDKIVLPQNRLVNKFPLLDDDFSMEEMLYVLSNSKSNSAPGPDGFKYMIYKHLNSRNLNFLLLFFNRIWSLGVRPAGWNKSNVIPVPKNPVVENPSQTRPINLINDIVKLMDKMVNVRLMYTLERENFIDGNQFGFRKNRRTIDSLMKLNNYVIKSLESNHVQLISFDIKKAFDKIWPSAILQKFQEFEIGGRMFEFIESFLQSRRSTVINGDFVSTEFFTNIGVPQGSPLSSTLFLIAFQNIIDELASIDVPVEFAAYADDLFIYCNDSSNMVNTKNLQKCINKISKVGLKVGLEFSKEKTKSLHICTKQNCNQISNKLYGTPIPKVDTLKLLGLTIQRKFKFGKHISILQSRLMKDLQVLKVISSTKYGLNQHLLRRIIIALSVSKVRYCIEIYGHCAAYLIKKIDVILDKMKRLMLGSFVTTPLVTLAIQSGIPKVADIASRCNVLCSIKMERSTYSQNSNSNNHIRLVNEILVSSGLFKVEVVKNLTLVSPQKSISLQVFPNIFKKKKADIDRNEVNSVLEEFVKVQGIVVSLFTDGSKMVNGTGYAVTSENQDFEVKKMHPDSSVFSAEAYAVLRAVQILQSLDPFNSVKFAIFTDSMSTISELKSTKRVKNEVVSVIKKLLTPNIVIAWVPSHFGIAGNEFADKKAREISESHAVSSNFLSTSDAVSTIKNHHNMLIQRQWDLQVDNKLFNVNPSANYVSFNNGIPRKFEWIFNRLRSGHTNMTHCFKITKTDEPSCKYCNSLLSIAHIFECMDPTAINNRNLSGLLNWRKDLFDDSKSQDIIDFLKRENYFLLI